MRPGVLVALIAVSTAFPAPRQSSPITSARLTVLKEPATDVIVQITNLRTAGLEHYAVRFGHETVISHRSQDSGPYGPVAQGQSAESRLSVIDAGARPTVVLLGFADGYFEGDRETLQQFFAEFGTPRGQSIAQARPAVVEGRSARVTARPVPGVRLVPVLENLRKVPLEAWSIGELEVGELRSGHTSDTCGVVDSPSGSGAILPGESRRLAPKSGLSPEEAVRYSLVLQAVLYRDGHVEGSRAALNRVFEGRKQRGRPC